MSARMNNAEVRLMTPLGWDISTVVSELREVREQSLADRQRTKQPPRLPSRKTLIGILDRLSTALFPNRLGTADLTDDSVDYFVGHTLDATLRDLLEQVRRELQFSSGQTSIRERDRERAIEITQTFATRLPEIRAVLDSDIRAAYEGDPAAGSVDEVLVCYPGVTAIIYHRLAHALHQLGVPLIARIIAEIAHSATGIDIHPGAEIGGHFFIDHGTGVVIGETAIIGQRVRLSWWNDGEAEERAAPEAHPALRAGDRWGFTVRLKRPHGLLNPGGFDYERWLYAKGIVATGTIRSQPPPRLLAHADRYPLDRYRQQVDASREPPPLKVVHPRRRQTQVRDLRGLLYLLVVIGVGWTAVQNLGDLNLSRLSAWWASGHRDSGAHTTSSPMAVTTQTQYPFQPKSGEATSEPAPPPPAPTASEPAPPPRPEPDPASAIAQLTPPAPVPCLLYTSDAADE